jgi:hypothetical protein
MAWTIAQFLNNATRFIVNDAKMAAAAIIPAPTAAPAKGSTALKRSNRSAASSGPK